MLTEATEQANDSQTNAAVCPAEESLQIFQRFDDYGCETEQISVMFYFRRDVKQKKALTSAVACFLSEQQRNVTKSTDMTNACCAEHAA